MRSVEQYGDLVHFRMGPMRVFLLNDPAHVKHVLMDSRLVVGVGNIYANEALFRAGIRPRRPSRSLKRAEVARLARSVRAVLRQAIKVGGTTLRDYVGADGTPGAHGGGAE